MHLIRSGAAGGLGTLIREQGGNPIELIKQVGLLPSQFLNPTTFISLEKLAELLERSALDRQSPYFGLLLGMRQRPGVLIDLLVSASQQKSVFDAIQDIADNLYLHVTGAHLKVEISGERLAAYFYYDIDTPLGINHLIQLGVGQLVNLIISMVEHDFGMATIHVRQAKPLMGDIPAGVCPCKLEFLSPFDGVSLHSSFASAPVHLDKNILANHFSEYLRGLKSRYPGNLLNQINEVIAKLLPTGDCSIDQVAATLSLGKRALQRKLKEEGTSYGGQLKEVRCAIAKQHLSQGYMSITDLALNLGYSDISVFSRHFKSWTGYSPREWKQGYVTDGSA